MRFNKYVFFFILEIIATLLCNLFDLLYKSIFNKIDDNIMVTGLCISLKFLAICLVDVVASNGGLENTNSPLPLFLIL